MVRERLNTRTRYFNEKNLPQELDNTHRMTYTTDENQPSSNATLNLPTLKICPDLQSISEIWPFPSTV